MTRRTRVWAVEIYYIHKGQEISAINSIWETQKAARSHAINKLPDYQTRVKPWLVNLEHSEWS